MSSPEFPLPDPNAVPKGPARPELSIVPPIVDQRSGTHVKDRQPTAPTTLPGKGGDKGPDSSDPTGTGSGDGSGEGRHRRTIWQWVKETKAGKAVAAVTGTAVVGRGGVDDCVEAAAV